MAAKKQKYYVVWQGHEPGVYKSWQECQAQVKNYPNARYKSYSSLAEARDAYDHGPEYSDGPKNKKRKTMPNPQAAEINQKALSVDAACSGNPGIMEYRAVWVGSGVEEFKKGPYQQGTNNIGEFLAIVHAAALFQKEGNTSTPIYTDSRTAMAWVRKKKANTQLKFNARNAPLKRLIERAELWLRNNKIPNPILKWNTKNWGEIPADFGRK
jgi:ribonuclease HI